MTELELLRKEYDQLNSRHNLLLERLARHFSNPIWHVENLGLSSDDIVKAGLYNEDGLYGMFPFQTSDPKPSSTQPAPSVPAGWLRAIDEALVVTHLGVANADDSYEAAKRKLNELIGWYTDVATDPAVNGGFKLVPADEQSAPSVLDDGFKRAVMEISDIGYGAIFKRMLCERAAELAETASESKP